MLKKINIKSLVDLYMISTILGLLIYIPFPQTMYFTGASAIIYAFLMAVGDVTKVVSYLCLAWIPIYIVSLITTYIFTRFVRKRKNYFPIIVVMTIELIIPVLLVILKISMGNYHLLIQILVGYALRVLYYALTVYYYSQSGDGSMIDK